MIAESFSNKITVMQSQKNRDETLPNRVLIVEDEARLLDHLTQVFKDEGFSTFTCASYTDLEGILALPAKRFDIIILDRLLNGRDSAGLIEKIKTDLPGTRIMVLSAINTPSEKAVLLDLGADDYLAKPFDSEELIARIRALLRRNYHSLKLGNVILNSLSRAMSIENNLVPLTNKEFALLKTFIQNPGKIFNKIFLYERVWEMSSEVDSNAVETTVNKLRRKLDDAQASIKIKNIRNEGYWIEE